MQSINYNATVSSDLYVVISAVCGRVFVVAASRVMMTGISTSLIRDCRLCCQREKWFTVVSRMVTFPDGFFPGKTFPGKSFPG